MSTVANGVREALIVTAKDLLDGADADLVSPEYLRGMIELIVQSTLSNEDSDAAYATVEHIVTEQLKGSGIPVSPKVYEVINDSSGHGLPKGAQVTPTGAPNWSNGDVQWYTQGGTDDEVAIDHHDLIEKEVQS